MTEKVTIEVEAMIDRFRAQMQDVKSELKANQKQVNDFQGQIGQISPTLGKFSKSMSQAFGTLKKDTKTASAGMKSVGASAQVGATTAKTAISGLTATLAPLLTAVMAIVGAILVMKKAWEYMKKGFKAWNPTGYAKVFGTFERAIRKFYTALGALSEGVVTKVMQTLIGVVEYATDFLEILVKIKTWIDEIADTLKPIFDVLVSMSGGGAFLNMIDMFAKKGKKAIEEVGEVWSKEMGVGLASFDKLNNIGMEEGDAKEREELMELIEEAEQASDDWLQGIKDWLDGVGKWFSDGWDSIVKSVSELWSDFVKWGSDAWNWLVKTGGEVWDALCKGASDLWNSFTQWAGDAWSWVSKTASDAWNGIVSVMSGFWDALVKLGTDAWNTISRVAGDIWNGLKSIFGGIWDAFTKIGSDAWNTISSIAGGIWNGIKSTISGVWDFFATAGKSAWDAIASAGKWFYDTILKPIADFFSWIIDGLNSLFGGGKSKSTNTATEIKAETPAPVSDSIYKEGAFLGINIGGGVFGKDWGYVNGSTDALQGGHVTRDSQKLAKLYGDVADTGKTIGMYEALNAFNEFSYNVPNDVIEELKGYLKGSASGELFEPGHPVLRWLGDNNREQEVAAPYSMIVSAVMTALGQASREGISTDGSKVLDVTLNIDGKKLARMQYDYLRDEGTRRNGSAPI